VYFDNGRLVLSPSDLVGYLYCPHLTELSLAVSRSLLAKPVRDDADLEVVQRRGLEHEARYLTQLEANSGDVAQVDTSSDLATQVEETLERLRSGPRIIYQAAFLDVGGSGPAWRGHADFLRRVDQQSALGDFSYEPEDTKLARHVRPSAAIQLCNYAGHLERIQGVAPEEIHVVLGGDRTESLRLADFAAYYRATKARFEAAIATEISAYPDPVGHCAVCSWREACDQQRIADDHLSLVANIRVEQIRKLHDAGIETVAALAQDHRSDVHGMVDATLDKLRDQARLQVTARSNPNSPPPYEILPDPGPGRGLNALAEPAPGDLFFDIEGDPFVGEGGLEYMLGVGWVEPEGGFGYQAFWGHNDAQEKQAFENFIDFVLQRLRDDPRLHVYHFAPYEPSALGRLMGRHATREEEVDGLFRGGTLIDLLQVVRQSVRVGTPSYGLKKLEGLYMAARTGAITDAGSSIVEYERWLECGDNAILSDLESYNKVDCESTLLLRNWLEERRPEYTKKFGSYPERPLPRDSTASVRVGDEASENAILMEALVQAASPQAINEAGYQASWLLAQLLDWYRREEKPEWWRFFDRVLRCDEDDHFADTESVAGLEYEGEVDRVARSAIHRYRFDPTQDHKVKTGSSWCDPDAERNLQLLGTKREKAGDIVNVDPVNGTLDLKRGLASTAPHPRCLIPPGPIPTAPQRQALRRLAASIVTNGIDGAGPYRAVRDLLLRYQPRLSTRLSQGVLRGDNEAPDDAVVRLASSLHGGTLAVQGPPGSGKTRTAARTIVELVRAGHRIGITANSHAVITNLLADVVACGEREGQPIGISQKSDEGGGLDHPWVTQRTSNDQMVSDLASASVLAGTAWLFCRPEFDQSLDFMVVDEAGQLSLANVVAVGTAARNLVMVGDPNQLAQPSKGTHPPGADVSGLTHLLGEAATMPPELGLFLDHTHRLHPAICAYISEVFYDSRLTSLPGCERQSVGGEGQVAGSGLRWCPVKHEGNRTSSVEEAEVIRQLILDIVGRKWTDRDGKQHTLGVEDILVVAPYNAQVSLLGHVLPSGVQIGTVDKFQGRQAAVLIVSLAASTAENVPRGMDFLYSRNRLNVAISRAKALSVIVASPALLSAQCHTVDQMRLVNGLCRFVELAVALGYSPTQAD
jgi:predicted RecB family nuclease